LFLTAQEIMLKGLVEVNIDPI